MTSKGHCQRGSLSAAPWRITDLLLVAWVLILTVWSPAPVRAQGPTTVAPLVFDSVTVIDVQAGRRIPMQRVTVVGNRIKTIGSVRAVPIPKGARVVNARGKYLIPGLWDMHVHPFRLTDIFYPLFIANGVTGIRDAWSYLPLDTLIQLRRDILAGNRVGPPRQVLSGPAIDQSKTCKRVAADEHTCVSSTDPADPARLVDSLKAAGADMLKMYVLSRPVYYAVAAEARRVGIPFGGHLMSNGPSATEASDSGARIIDHPSANGGLDTLCTEHGATIERCRPVAAQFRRNDTWWVPTWIPFSDQYDGNNPRTRHINERFNAYISSLWSKPLPLNNEQNYLSSDTAEADAPDSVRLMSVAQQTGLPTLAGTDVNANDKFLKTGPPGFALHEELAMYVAEGFTPLSALQSATLNPAKMLHATDSLGTVAAGKLADLVLLDADPLTDIANTTTIHAVVANGRYFDRAALDQLLIGVQAIAKQFR